MVPTFLQAKLTASDPTTNSAFGTSVAIFGDTVVVGSPQTPSDPPKPDRTGCTGGSCQAGQCQPECDATLQLTAVPSFTSGQQPVTLRAQVANAGPSRADQLVLTLDLRTDPGFAVKQLQGDGWGCQSAEASVRCTRSQLPVGAAPDVTMQVVPPIGQASFTIKGTIGATTSDANLLNNTAEVRVINLAPCTTGCMVESGGDEPAAGCHCQLGGRAPAPPAGWALIALGLLAWRRQKRRQSAYRPRRQS